MPSSVTNHLPSRHVNQRGKLTSPPSALIGEGVKVRLASGTIAVVQHWRVRTVDLENLDSGVERIAILRTRTGAELECSEAYMRKAEVL